MSRRLDKVVGFVTRGVAGKGELLLFRHPTAGIQLPAGTVEPGEDPVTAVLREIREETGLADVEIARTLQVQRQPTNGQQYLLRTTKLFDAPAPDANGIGPVLYRGEPVEWIADEGKFSYVRCVARQECEQSDARQPLCLGYVRRSVLSEILVRHLFHCVAQVNTGHAWQRYADGHLFECHWAPLTPMPRHLVQPQQLWLEQVYDDLVPSVGP